ncbi:MAG: cytochrome-c oxidase, cbb3-type subunit III [Burkholderiales bacterium]
MADFTSGFWSGYIAIGTIVSLLFCIVLLIFTSSRTVIRDEKGNIQTSGHVWDEDLTEYNNPLPRWWMWLFYITIFFSLIYLYLYPGLGGFTGSLAWSSTGQYAEEVKKAEAESRPLFAKFLAKDAATLATDPQAREIGARLFLNYCAQCHGSDARGSKGFPNLTDRDWMWGGTPEAIKTSILAGRNGVMPPMAAALGGEEEVKNVANYTLSLSGAAHDSIAAQKGRAKFAVCAACHGADGRGNPALGAPNLTDKIWLYGGGVAAVTESIVKGRDNMMPAHREFLGEAKVHLLTAWVFGLGGGEAPAAPAAAAPAPATAATPAGSPGSAAAAAPAARAGTK